MDSRTPLRGALEKFIQQQTSRRMPLALLGATGFASARDDRSILGEDTGRASGTQLEIGIPA